MTGKRLKNPAEARQSDMETIGAQVLEIFAQDYPVQAGHNPIDAYFWAWTTGKTTDQINQRED